MREAKSVVATSGARHQHSAAAATAASSAGDAWVPRGFLVRGWAPFGCPPKERTLEDQAKQNIREIMVLLPETERALVRPAVPFATNHQYFFGVSDEFHCRRIVSLLKNKVEETGYTIKGKPLSISVETSPDRRAQCKNFYDACRLLENVGASNRVLCCQRGLRVYLGDSHELLGSNINGRWVWSAALDTLGSGLAERVRAEAVA